MGNEYYRERHMELEELYLHIPEDLREGMSVREVASKYNVAESFVQSIDDGLCKMNLPKDVEAKVKSAEFQEQLKKVLYGKPSKKN